MMKLLPCMLVAGLMLVPTPALDGQTREDNTVVKSMGVLNEIMAVPAKAIPARMLQDAYAVAIIPDVIKGSFVIGARHGNGVLLVRDPTTGGWHAPVFISLTGGNIGWQVGVQSTDVILVFKTPQSVNGLMSGKFTLGADASIAAGPVGRQAAAATDGQLGAEIFSWSRSRGLFLGVSLDGSVIEMDPMANAAYYRRAAPDGPVVVPQAAQQLALELLKYTGQQPPTSGAGQTLNASTTPATAQQPILAAQHSREEADHVRDQLATFARELYEVLDPAWQQYLALPAQVFSGNGNPPLNVLEQSLARFDTVRTNPQYRALADHPEFQSTYGLLKHYIQELSQSSKELNLPPPPPPPAPTGR